MADAAAAFKKKVGAPIKAISLEITRDKAILIAQDPNGPNRVNEYRYNLLGWSGPYPVNVATLDPLEQDFKVSVFPLDEIDLAATPQVVNAALARVNIEEGKVSKIDIEVEHDLLNFNPNAKRFPVHWHIEIEGPRESATAIANPKGEIVALDLSRTARAKEQDYFDARALADAVKQVKQVFGGQVYLARFQITKRALFLQAATLATSDEVHQYQFDLSGVKRIADAPLILFNEGTKLKNHDFYFTLDDIDFSKISQVLETSFEKSKMAHPIVTNMSFSRPIAFASERVNPVEWQVSVGEEGRMRDTYLSFDANGNFLRK